MSKKRIFFADIFNEESVTRLVNASTRMTNSYLSNRDLKLNYAKIIKMGSVDLKKDVLSHMGEISLGQNEPYMINHIN